MLPMVLLEVFLQCCTMSHDLYSPSHREASHCACVHAQAQLQLLACICWSEPLCATDTLQLDTVSTAQSQLQLQHNTVEDVQQCRWTQEGFPKGPALLTHLHNELTDADSDAAPLLRELMLAAIQPYMRHVRSWLYSTAAVSPEFVSGDVDDLNGMQALHAAVLNSTQFEVRFVCAQRVCGNITNKGISYKRLRCCAVSTHTMLQHCRCVRHSICAFLASGQADDRDCIDGMQCSHVQYTSDCQSQVMCTE